MASKIEDTIVTDFKYKDITTKVSECGTIYSIIIDKPKKMNAVSFATLHEIRHYIENHVNPFSSGARCVVFYGAGKHFTSGLDLSSNPLDASSGKDGEEEPDTARKANRMYDHVAWG